MELKNLSRLRSLGVCGINRGNLKKLCSAPAISGHAHLESLSVHVVKDGKQGLLCHEIVSIYKKNQIENLNKLTPFIRKTGPKTVQEREKEEKPQQRTRKTRHA